jgi:uncharacterized membrane protein YphA (DoxX/SURF4 family)
MMEATPYPKVRWSGSAKFFMRFFSIYFLLYIFPFPLDQVIPTLSAWLSDFWMIPIKWMGKNLLHLSYEITIKPNGSGDTTYNYVQILLFAILALFGTLLWSIFDRKRPDYHLWSYWMRVALRFYLFATMCSYGFYKVIKLQFPFPGLSDLLQPLGTSSPMGLAWNFMGYSKGYNQFTGWAEIISGILLIFPRTTTLGALMTMMVMGNVMALNFFYDIPVKLFSTHLFCMALFILWPDLNRVLNFFIFNAEVKAKRFVPVFNSNGLMIAKNVVKWGFVLISLGYFNLYSVLKASKEYGDTAPNPPLYGIHEVKNFVHNGDTIPPLLSDTLRWRYLVVNWSEFASTRMVNDSVHGYAFKVDEKKRIIEMNHSEDTTIQYKFKYLYSQDRLHLEGGGKRDTFLIECQLLPKDRFLLVNRGYHWVNERPFNR